MAPRLVIEVEGCTIQLLEHLEVHCGILRVRVQLGLLVKKRCNFVSQQIHRDVVQFRLLGAVVKIVSHWAENIPEECAVAFCFYIQPTLIPSSKPSVQPSK